MKGKVVYIIGACFTVLLVVLLIAMPKQQDWSDSFSQASKQPYGSKLIEKNIRPFFPKVEKVEVTVYQHLELNEYGYTNQDSGAYSEDESINEEQENTEEYTSPDSIAADSIVADSANAFTDSLYDVEYNATTEDEELVNIDAISDKKLRKVFSNYIFINTYIEFDETDLNSLFNYVKKGNNVFIAASWFRGKVADTFNLKTDNTYLGDTISTGDFVSKKRTPVEIRLLNKNFPTTNYKMSGIDFGNSFSSIDSSRKSEILGVNSKNEVNFIRVKVGDGYFYISSIPHAYTNFAFSRKEMAGYTASSISYLPNQTTYWDEYYKIGRVHERDSLDFLRNNIALWWSWRIALIGFLLYMIFESKRYQRMIPVVKKLHNSTVEFVYTMGRLYLQRGDHHDLAAKKIQYFLEQIRHGFYLPTHEFTEEFKSRLSQRSGVERKEIEHLFNQIAHMQKSNYCSKENLIDLTDNIDYFKSKSKLR